jgi:tetratricopeptide (TPR) repeat protein
VRSLSALPLLLALAAGPAPAQEPAPASAEEMSDEERFALAKTLFEKGKLAYDLGKFEAAVEHFEKAHALRPAPLLLFNLGQSHRHLGHWAEAAHLYEGFLRIADEDMPQRELAEQMLTEMRAKEAEAVAAEPEAAEVAEDAETATTTTAPAAQTESLAPAEEAEDTLGTRLLWGGVVAGTAVVAAVVTTVAVAMLAAPPPPGDGGTLDLR